MPWSTRCRNTASGISTCRQPRSGSGRRSIKRSTGPARHRNRQASRQASRHERETMTQAIDLPLPATPAAETKFVGTVCFVHFASHFYITLLAPLFLFVRADYGVSYTELGLAFTAFNVISTALQTPAGFLVDRVSARLLLVAGLLVGAIAFTIAALVDSFWVLVAMFALAGLGNTVYHPADYALLSRHVPAARAGRAFSFHTFAGMLGNAAAPPSLLFLQSMVGWRGAFLGAAVLGLVAALVVAVSGEPPELEPAPGNAKAR